MRIAVDAVGGDHGPQTVIPGAVEGARRFGVDLVLVGPEAELRRILATTDTTGVTVEVVNAPDTIAMDESPAQAVRRKPDADINVALRLVKDGRADAMVSCGNSGAVMAAALLNLGRTPGIDRPAIASPLPSARGRTLVLDLGAVTDPKPLNLVQFARMGVIFSQRALGIPHPTVGLLSNGEEPGKGNQLVQETYELLKAEPDLNFHGNVEGRDVPRGIVDVVVTDGFTSNVLLKVAEGAASFVGEIIREEITATFVRKLAAGFLKPAFRRAKERIDYAETGGALLLGVNGVTVIAHGRSNERAIANAVGVAARAAEAMVPQAIADAIDSARAKVA